MSAFDDPDEAARTGGSTPRALVGQHVLIAHHAMKARANPLRQRLTHVDADVRATAGVALGVVGSPSVLPVLARLLADPEPRVRRAAVFAVRALGDRLDRADLAENYIAGLAADPDPAVRAAIKR